METRVWSIRGGKHLAGTTEEEGKSILVACTSALSEVVSIPVVILMEILIAPLGLTDYLCAWRTQQHTHARRQETGENILLVTEHHPVVTFGYRRQA